MDSAVLLHSYIPMYNFLYRHRAGGVQNAPPGGALVTIFVCQLQLCGGIAQSILGTREDAAVSLLLVQASSVQKIVKLQGNGILRRIGRLQVQEIVSRLPTLKQVQRLTVSFNFDLKIARCVWDTVVK